MYIEYLNPYDPHMAYVPLHLVDFYANHTWNGIRQLKRRAVAETLAFLAVRKVRGSHGMLVFLKEGRWEKGAQHETREFNKNISSVS